MKTKNTKPKVITSGELTAQVSSGKFGEYRYRSPRYGYKRAYRYDKMIGVYHKNKRIAYFGVKYWTISGVKSYLQEVNDLLSLIKSASSLVPLYKKAKELNIDYGFVRDYRATSGIRST